MLLAAAEAGLMLKTAAAATWALMIEQVRLAARWAVQARTPLACCSARPRFCNRQRRAVAVQWS